MSLADVDIAILCGGRGTRLKPVIGDLPKALAPIKGRPCIEYILGHIRGSGGQKVYLITGHGHDAMAAWFADYRHGFQNFELLRDMECSGFESALDRLTARMTTPGSFMIMNGDTLIVADLSKFDHIDEPIAFNVRGIHSGIICGGSRWLWLRPFAAQCVEVFTGLDFLDIGTPEGYASAESWVEEHVHDHNAKPLPN